MKEFNFNINYKLDKYVKRTIVLGKFNSFHIAHQKVLQLGKQLAKNKKNELIVMIYPDKNPMNSKAKIIFDFETRKAFLKKLGVDHVMIFEPNPINYRLKREQFSNFLKENLNVDSIVIGQNFSFGKKDIFDDIQYLKDNFDLSIVKIEKNNNQEISSTLISSLINERSFTKVSEILGFNYFIKGKVIRGDGYGKFLLTPTANIEIDDEFVDIPDGVYYTLTMLYNNKKYYSLTSISSKPTFENRKREIETYIFEYSDKDFYNTNITIEFIDFQREIKKFPSINELKNQLVLDKNDALDFFNKKYK